MRCETFGVLLREWFFGYLFNEENAFVFIFNREPANDSSHRQQCPKEKRCSMRNGALIVADKVNII